MATVLVITAAGEGGLYSPAKNPLAAIRIYSDRWVYDAVLGRWRERLNRSEARRIRKAAAQNRAEGLV